MRRIVIHLCLCLSAFLPLVGCVSSGEVDQESFVGHNSGKGTEFVSSSSDAPEISSLLNQLEQSDSELERKELISRLIGYGEQALPFIKRKSARASHTAFSLDLLYIESQIEQPISPVNEKAPDAESSPPDPSPHTNESSELSNSTEPNYGIHLLYNDEGEFDADEIDLFVKSRFARAYRSYQDGDRGAAIQICQAILTLVPETRYRRQVQQLLQDATTAAQHTRFLAGKIRFEEPFVQIGEGGFPDELKVSIYIKNVSTRKLSLDFGSELHSLLALEIRLSEADSLGSSKSSGISRAVELSGEQIILAPDQSIELSRSLGSLGELPELTSNFTWQTRLEVGASLRLASLSDPETNEYHSRPVLLSPASAALIPQSYPLDQARNDPILFLGEVLKGANTEHLLFTHALIAESDRRLALDLLLSDSIESTGIAMRRARLTLARELSGEDLGEDTDAWRTWWKEHRSRYQ